MPAHSRQTWKFQFALAWVVLMSLAGGVKGVTVAELVDAMQARAEKYKRFRMTWVEHRTTIKGSHNISMFTPNVPGEGGAIPPQDVTHDIQHELIMDGDLMRWEWKGMIWHEMQRDFVLQEELSCWDGQTSLDYRPLYFSHKGQIKAGATWDVKRNPHARWNRGVQPIMFWTRMTDPIAGIFPDFGADYATKNLKLGGTTTIDGTRCVILVGPGDHVWPRMTLWLEAQAPHRPRRWLSHMAAGSRRPAYQINYEYLSRSDEFPTGWRWHWWTGDDEYYREIGASRCEVQALARLDAPIPIESFQFTFPLGTRIAHHPNVDAEYAALSRSKGSDAPIAPAERGNLSDPQLSTSRIIWIISVSILLFGVIAWSARTIARFRNRL